MLIVIRSGGGSTAARSHMSTPNIVADPLVGLHALNVIAIEASLPSPKDGHAAVGSEGRSSQAFTDSAMPWRVSVFGTCPANQIVSKHATYVGAAHTGGSSTV
jgi:hypothetical protein